MPNDWALPGEGTAYEPAAVGLHDAVIAEYEALPDALDMYKKMRKYGRWILQVAETEKDGQRKEVTWRRPLHWGFDDAHPSQLRKDLERWKQNPMTEQEMREFDPPSLVGKPCIVYVSHSKPNANGRVYANVESIDRAGGTKLSVLNYTSRAVRRANREAQQAGSGTSQQSAALPDDDVPF